MWTAWQLRARGASVALLEAERVRARAERPQRRLLRDALDPPAVAGRAVRARAGAVAVPGVGRECARDRRVVLRARRRRVVHAVGLPDGLDGAGARCRDRRHRRRRAAASSCGRWTARRCARGATRRASAAGCSCPTTRPCSRRGSRSACVRRLLDVIHEHSRVVALRVVGLRGGRFDGGRERARRRRGAGGERRHARNPAAAPPVVGHLVAHRAHRAGPGRAGRDRLDGRRVHHRRADVRALLPHHPGRPDRVRVGRRPPRAGRAAGRAGRGRRRGRGGDPPAPGRDVPGAARAARSRTRGAARSTSPRATCRRSGRSTALRSTTRSATRATASGRRTSRAASSRGWRRVGQLAPLRPRAGPRAAGAAGLGGRNARTPCLFT